MDKQSNSQIARLKKMLSSFHVKQSQLQTTKHTISQTLDRNNSSMLTVQGVNTYL